MFNLERAERAVIIFLIGSLLLGLGVMIYKKSNQSIDDIVIQKGNPQGYNSYSKTKEKININEASVGDLMRLRGVGKVLAHRIIDHRFSKGPFIYIDDIKKVKGIGNAFFEKIKDDISVE